jgi:hypothetical protein
MKTADVGWVDFTDKIDYKITVGIRGHDIGQFRHKFVVV